MRLSRPLLALMLALLAAALLSACEQPRTYPVAPTYNYVVPATTYLRSCASYTDDCPVTATVYSGDRVVVLDRNDYGWARVQLERTGAIGWIPGDLLSLSPIPATFYVTLNNVYLRDCADYNCRPVELLNRGDRVEKLDQDFRGWWRVVSAKTRNSGWVPASALATRPGPPYYYVAVNGLALRSGPSTANKMLTSLSLNAQVELLGSGAGGWVQVREVRTGMMGWVASHYLESFPVAHAKPVPGVPKKRPAAKKGAPAAPPEEAPAPPAAEPPAAPPQTPPAEAPPKPKAM